MYKRLSQIHIDSTGNSKVQDWLKHKIETGIENEQEVAEWDIEEIKKKHQIEIKPNPADNTLHSGPND